MHGYRFNPKTNITTFELACIYAALTTNPVSSPGRIVVWLERPPRELFEERFPSLREMGLDIGRHFDPVQP